MFKSRKLEYRDKAERDAHERRAYEFLPTEQWQRLGELHHDASLRWLRVSTGGSAGGVIATLSFTATHYGQKGAVDIEFLALLVIFTVGLILVSAATRFEFLRLVNLNRVAHASQSYGDPKSAQRCIRNGQVACVLRNLAAFTTFIGVVFGLYLIYGLTQLP